MSLALARRAQRGGGTIRDALLDTRQVWQWGRVWNALGKQVESTEVTVPTATGYWAGEIIAANDAAADKVTLLPALRTGLSNELIEDEALCFHIGRLRELGPAEVDRRETAIAMQYALNRLEALR